MTLQNMRDICRAVIKELQNNFDDDEYTESQVIKTIEFVKPRRTKTTEVLQFLVDFGFLYQKDTNREIYYIGRKK